MAKSLSHQIGAYTLHALCPDPTAHTQPARDAFLARFEREVDPDGLLTPEDRARRAEHLRKAYFKRLALKSAQARRARAGTADPGPRAA